MKCLKTTGQVLLAVLLAVLIHDFLDEEWSTVQLFAQSCSQAVQSGQSWGSASWACSAVTVSNINTTQ